jgi:hypothetical protein
MEWAPYNHEILTGTTLVITTDGKWVSKKEQVFPEIHCYFHKKEELCEKWMQMALFRATNGFSHWRDI